MVIILFETLFRGPRQVSHLKNLTYQSHRNLQMACFWLHPPATSWGVLGAVSAMLRVFDAGVANFSNKSAASSGAPREASGGDMAEPTATMRLNLWISFLSIKSVTSGTWHCTFIDECSSNISHFWFFVVALQMWFWPLSPKSCLVSLATLSSLCSAERAMGAYKGATARSSVFVEIYG